jgi:hypothetical protein
MGTGLQCELGYAIKKQLASQEAAKSYPTREQCESARQGSTKSNECISVVYGPCTGPGGNDDGFSNGIGNTDITGTNQGNPFYTDNPFDALQDAYDQKTFQNEVLLENGEPDRTITRDIPFDNAVRAITYINGRGVATGKPFDRSFGRAGETGGSNIRPTRASVANRYGGSQRGIKSSEDLAQDLGVNYTQGKETTVSVNHRILGSASATMDAKQLQQKIKEQMPTPKAQLEGINTDIKEIENMVQEKIKTLEAEGAIEEAAELQTTLDNIIEPQQPQQTNEQPQPQQTNEQPCDAACDQAKIEKRSAMLKDLQGAFPDIAERLKRKKQQQQQTGGKK